MCERVSTKVKKKKNQLFIKKLTIHLKVLCNKDG